MSYSPLHARPARTMGRRLLGVAALTASFLVPAAISSVQAADPICPTSPDKCYSLTITTSPVGPAVGQSTTFTGTLKNLSRKGTGVSLGSANVTWSPADALYDVAAGGASPAGTESISGNTVALRNLAIQPGKSGTFTFTAKPIRAGNISWSSVAKQSNDFNGTGNNFLLIAATAPTAVSGSCNGDVTYNSYGCAAYLKSAGTVISGSGLDSSGNPTVLPFTVTIRPMTPDAGSSPFHVAAYRTYAAGDQCPLEQGVVPCTFTMQQMFPNAQEARSAGLISWQLTCGSLCGAGTLLFQREESTGVTEPILPCVLTLVPSPLTGSRTCGEITNGVLNLENITNVNDYKVMGVSLGG
jgi:hypothetical protein